MKYVNFIEGAMAAMRVRNPGRDTLVQQRDEARSLAGRLRKVASHKSVNASIDIQDELDAAILAIPVEWEKL